MNRAAAGFCTATADRTCTSTSHTRPWRASTDDRLEDRLRLHRYRHHHHNNNHHHHQQHHHHHQQQQQKRHRPRRHAAANTIIITTNTVAGAAAADVVIAAAVASWRARTASWCGGLFVSPAVQRRIPPPCPPVCFCIVRVFPVSIDVSNTRFLDDNNI